MKYFTLGLPKDQQDPLYGLYHPVLDCILVVHHSLTIIQQLRALLSSRYSTFIVLINRAKNYQLNIIDNQVCTNWTISNRGDIRVIYGVSNLPVVAVDQLIEKDTYHSWDYNKEKQWVLFCVYYLSLIDEYKNSVSFSSVDAILNDFLQLNEHYYNAQALKNIMKELYFGLEIKSSEKIIQQLIKSDEDLENFYVTLFPRLYK